MRVICGILFALIANVAYAQHGGPSNDPFVLTENYRNDPTPLNNAGNYYLPGHTCQTSCVPVINTSIKTLVLITAGDSQGASVGPSAYVPTNLSVIDNFNIYDGALYADLDPLLGQTQSLLGPGSIGPRVADQFINNSIFARVILVPVAVGGATSGMYAPGGVLYDRICVAMRRLAQRGITPSTTGVTFAIDWFNGENDTSTPQATYQANQVSQTAHLATCGASGVRQFIGSAETILGGTANATVAAAQAALVSSGAPYYAGGNFDSLTGTTNRQPDLTHFNTNSNSVGQGAAATLIYNAMHASGAPF